MFVEPLFPGLVSTRKSKSSCSNHFSVNPAFIFLNVSFTSAWVVYVVFNAGCIAVDDEFAIFFFKSFNLCIIIAFSDAHPLLSFVTATISACTSLESTFMDVAAFIVRCASFIYALYSRCTSSQRLSNTSNANMIFADFPDAMAISSSVTSTPHSKHLERIAAFSDSIFDAVL